MRQYHIEITMPPYPERGYRHKVHQREPVADECSPSLVHLIGPIEASSSADAVATALYAGVRAAMELSEAQREQAAAHMAGQR